MTSTDYAFGDGKFYEVELGFVDGKATIVSDPVEVPPEQAVPSLIQDYTSGRLGGTTDNIENGATFSREKPVDMYGEVIAPTARSVLSQPGSASEQFQTLHRLFGDDPKVISLVANGGDGTGRQLAEQIWGADKVSEVLQNYTPADESPKVIENSRASKGAGTSPSQNETGTTQKDSSGQGTSSSVTSDSKTGGDPIILFSGQFYYQATDLEVKGRGLNFVFTRTYLNQTIYKGPLGYRWDHTYNLWLREEVETLPNGNLQNVVYRSTGQLREDRYVQDVEPSEDLQPLSEFSDSFCLPQGSLTDLRNHRVDMYWKQ